MKKLRFSIVTRLMLLFSLIVTATAVLVYYGTDYGKANIREVEQEAQMQFLAGSISFGIRNYVVTSRPELIKDVVFEVLNKNVNPEIVVTKCRVLNEDKKEVFLYEDKLQAPLKIKTLSSPVTNEDSGGAITSIGTVTLDYYIRPSAEIEKTRQIITIGNTLAAMFQVFYKNGALFQARELVETVKKDNNILYCLIVGSDDEVHFSYRGKGRNIEKLLTPEREKIAFSVTHARPIIIQDVADTESHGKIIDVAILIEQGDEKLGVVRIGYSLKSWTEKIQRTRLAMSLILCGFVFLSLCLSYYLSRSISMPIMRLTRVARSISKEAPKKEIDLTDAEQDIEQLAVSFEAIASRLKRRKDEVGDLAESFSQLISSLENRVSDLREMFQKMSQTDRLFAMGQLSAGIAHEINNPLAIISTYVQIIGKRKDIDDELREEIKIISEEIERIAEKVKDLLSFAQDSEVRFTKADLHFHIRKTMSLMRYQFKKHSIEVVEDFRATDPLMLNLDMNKIRQVILNLALNALQAMDSGGTLTVGTRLEDGEKTVVISMKDTGHGISEEDLPRIFDPFFTRRKVGEGTGMGLAISYSIVKAHGGEIEVSSEPGKGTEFAIRIPNQ